MQNTSPETVGPLRACFNWSVTKILRTAMTLLTAAAPHKSSPHSYKGQHGGQVSQEPGDVLSIGHVSPHNQGNLLLPQLLDGYLKWVGLSLEVDKNRGIHAMLTSIFSSLTSRQRQPAHIASAYLICRARVPRIRAFSYLVM